MTSDSGLPVRPELAGVRAYGAPRIDVRVRLNVNENPYPPSPDLADEIADAARAAATGLNRYPDPEARGLREALARYLGDDLSWQQIWAGNGSNEVMLHVLLAFGGAGRTALSFVPTYSMYPEYARSTGTTWVGVARRPDHTIDIDAALDVVAAEQPAVVFLATPNNPTGTSTPLDVIDAIYRAARGIVVVDEAYAEFRSAGAPSAVELLPGRPRLVVARTMSKAFGLAGARVGYLAAGSDLVDVLRLVRLPYHLSALTQSVAQVALAHAAELLATVDVLRAEREKTAALLRAQGYAVADSDANFVLVEDLDNPHEVWEGLVSQGVLVRETAIPHALRVSIGTPDDMQRFHAAWTEVAPVRVSRERVAL